MADTIATGETAGGPAQQRAHGSSFYAAMRIMPPGQREAMFEIYSFCRAVDDIADDQGSPELRLKQLENWRADISSLYAGRVPPVLSNLAQAVRTFDLDRRDFDAIIDGMEMDVVANIQAPAFAALDLYCDRVASAVGRMSSRVFGLDHDGGNRLAHELGRALQLTNILRDLDEDASIQRLYLPREYLVDAGIMVTDPDAVLADRRLPGVCQRIEALARQHFAAADAIMNVYPKKIVRTPRVMAAAYKSILNTLAERGWGAPRERVRLSKRHLGLILLRHFIF